MSSTPAPTDPTKKTRTRKQKNPMPKETPNPVTPAPAPRSIESINRAREAIQGIVSANTDLSIVAANTIANMEKRIAALERMKSNGEFVLKAGNFGARNFGATELAQVLDVPNLANDIPECAKIALDVMANLRDHPKTTPDAEATVMIVTATRQFTLPGSAPENVAPVANNVGKSGIFNVTHITSSLTYTPGDRVVGVVVMSRAYKGVIVFGVPTSGRPYVIFYGTPNKVIENVSSKAEVLYVKFELSAPLVSSAISVDVVGQLQCAQGLSDINPCSFYSGQCGPLSYGRSAITRPMTKEVEPIHFFMSGQETSRTLARNPMDRNNESLSYARNGEFSNFEDCSLRAVNENCARFNCTLSDTNTARSNGFELFAGDLALGRSFHTTTSEEQVIFRLSDNAWALKKILYGDITVDVNLWARSTSPTTNAYVRIRITLDLGNGTFYIYDTQQLIALAPFFVNIPLALNTLGGSGYNRGAVIRDVEVLVGNVGPYTAFDILLQPDSSDPTFSGSRPSVSISFPDVSTDEIYAFYQVLGTKSNYPINVGLTAHVQVTVDPSALEAQYISRDMTRPIPRSLWQDTFDLYKRLNNSFEAKGLLGGLNKIVNAGGKIYKMSKQAGLVPESISKPVGMLSKYYSQNFTPEDVTQCDSSHLRNVGTEGVGKSASITKYHAMNFTRNNNYTSIREPDDFELVPSSQKHQDVSTNIKKLEKESDISAKHSILCDELESAFVNLITFCNAPINEDAVCNRMIQDRLSCLNALHQGLKSSMNNISKAPAKNPSGRQFHASNYKRKNPGGITYDFRQLRDNLWECDAIYGDRSFTGSGASQLAAKRAAIEKVNQYKPDNFSFPAVQTGGDNLFAAVPVVSKGVRNQVSDTFMSNLGSPSTIIEGTSSSFAIFMANLFLYGFDVLPGLFSGEITDVVVNDNLAIKTVTAVLNPVALEEQKINESIRGGYKLCGLFEHGWFNGTKFAPFNPSILFGPKTIATAYPFNNGYPSVSYKLVVSLLV